MDAKSFASKSFLTRNVFGSTKILYEKQLKQDPKFEMIFVDFNRNEQ